MMGLLLSVIMVAHAKAPEKIHHKTIDTKLAIKTFGNFLRCPTRPQKGSISLNQCISQYLTKDLGPETADQYSIILKYGGTNSPLSPCDPETKQLVETFEHRKPELYLCFTSQYFGGPKTGIVFFRSERGIPKISRIKW